MGCGASSANKAAVEAPASKSDAAGTARPPSAKDAATKPPPPSKNSSAKKVPVDRAASLGRGRRVNDSLSISLSRKKVPDLAPVDETKPTTDATAVHTSSESATLRSTLPALRSASHPGFGAADRPRPKLKSEQSMGRLPPLLPLGGRGPKATSTSGAAPQRAPTTYGTSARPALQVPRLTDAGLCCLAPAPYEPEFNGTGTLPASTQVHIQRLLDGPTPDQATAAVAHIREQLCGPTWIARARGLVDAGALVPLIGVLRDGPAAARVDAAWALTNVAASPDYVSVEAVSNEEAHAPLVAAAAAGAGAGAGTPAAALACQALWALGNLAGALHPGLKTQALAVEVLDAGALKAVLAVVEAEVEVAEAAHAKAAEGRKGAGPTAPALAPATPLLRCALWCLHNLAKHKREKEMVDAIPLATRLLGAVDDPEALTCCVWVLAYLGSNEDNKSHMKQVLPVLPRLVEWVREANSSLAFPSLLSLGTLCTGYMKALDYSDNVVDAGGVPAMLAYLLAGSDGGHRVMVKEALFALSNVAGGNNATVSALLDAGAFEVVLNLLRGAGEDEDIRMECLYVLTNPWDPLVGIEVPTAQGLVESGILQELNDLLDPAAPSPRLGLCLKGLADGVKRGQQLMTHAARMLVVEYGPEGAASQPEPTNPVVEAYVANGTLGRIQALNGHTDPDVAMRANGMLTVLQFFVEPRVRME